MIQNCLKKAAKDYSKSTLHMMMVLGQILGWACKNDLIRKSPCIGIKLPQMTDTVRCLTRRAIPEQQIDALVAMLPEPCATLVLTLEQTGLRIGEAAALKKPDFDDTLIHTDGHALA
jgi:integrase